MPETRIFHTHSVEETEALGENMAREIRPGDVLCLTGNLGAGKTAWVRGLALGLHATRAVSSPTFTLINEYPGPVPLYHFDLYRLNHPAELEALGYEEYFYGSGVTVVEWAEKAAEWMPPACWRVVFDILADDHRRITVSVPRKE